jgi:hypothetical protein
VLLQGLEPEHQATLPSSAYTHPPKNVYLQSHRQHWLVTKSCQVCLIAIDKSATDPEVLKDLVAEDYNLCLAISVFDRDSGISVNVVALVIPSSRMSFMNACQLNTTHQFTDLSPKNDISLNTNYIIAATDQPFEAGNGIIFSIPRNGKHVTNFFQ